MSGWKWELGLMSWFRNCTQLQERNSQRKQRDRAGSQWRLDCGGKENRFCMLRRSFPHVYSYWTHNTPLTDHQAYTHTHNWHIVTHTKSDTRVAHVLNTQTHMPTIYCPPLSGSCANLPMFHATKLINRQHTVHTLMVSQQHAHFTEYRKLYGSFCLCHYITIYSRKTMHH